MNSLALFVRRAAPYALCFVLGAGVAESRLRARTELVVVNASGQALQNVVIDLPSGPLRIGDVPAWEAAHRWLRPEKATNAWKPHQEGAFKDGRPIHSSSVTGSPGRLLRLRYTVLPDGEVSTSRTTTD